MKAFVGVSGGVDSSVSAALLKEAGHDVVGVFLRVWQPEFLSCTWRDDRTDAKRVCATLGIPFLELDCADVYKQKVVDYMIAEYRMGRTPNPDVMCNGAVKFGVFYDTAMRMGADIVATGHYARVGKTDDDTPTLLAGVDPEKDQSYFLWNIQKEHLAHIMFPIGDKIKRDVRTLAEQFNLHTATKKDSQGVCFLGKLDMHDFLAHFIETKPGDVLNDAGEVIGHHDGATFLTLGQRHGFIITTKTPHDKPYYIIAKDVEHNTITVRNATAVEHNHPSSQYIALSHTNWLTPPAPGKTYDARLRYRQKLFHVEMKEMTGTTARIQCDEPQAFVPIGQSLVLYDGDRCLGGGIIEGN